MRVQIFKAGSEREAEAQISKLHSRGDFDAFIYQIDHPLEARIHERQKPYDCVVWAGCEEAANLIILTYECEELPEPPTDQTRNVTLRKFLIQELKAAQAALLLGELKLTAGLKTQ